MGARCPSSPGRAPTKGCPLHAIAYIDAYRLSRRLKPTPPDLSDGDGHDRDEAVRIRAGAVAPRDRERVAGIIDGRHPDEDTVLAGREGGRDEEVVLVVRVVLRPSASRRALAVERWDGVAA